MFLLKKLRNTFETRVATQTNKLKEERKKAAQCHTRGNCAGLTIDEQKETQVINLINGHMV